MPFDRQTSDATPRPRDEFWGEQAEWTPQRPPSAPRAGIGATVGRWCSGLLSGGVDAGRVHGRPPASTPPNVEPDGERSPRAVGARDRSDDGVDARADDDDDETWTFEAEPRPSRRGGVDPLLARLGVVAVIVTLAAPLVVGFTADGADAQPGESLLSTIAAAAPGEAPDPTSAAAIDSTPVGVTVAPDAPTAAATPDTVVSDAITTPPTTETDSGSQPPEVAAALEAAPEPEPEITATVVTSPPCAGRYELAAGDYWIRIADAAGVPLADLLAVNGSSVDTVLVPGRSICLPAGAATPAPPTAAPSTPATTAPPARQTPTTAAPARPAPPATTAAPAPTPPARPPAVPRSQAEAIIRDIWPDDLEERALDIAWRESNHQSNVNNYCCYGLFQIHWNAHKSWLATLGITSASQLYDPVVNTNVAYALYQRSGGFGPWGG